MKPFTQLQHASVSKYTLHSDYLARKNERNKAEWRERYYLHRLSVEIMEKHFGVNLDEGS